MGGMLNPSSIKKALNPFKAPAHTGGLIGFDDPFRQGTSSAKRELEARKREFDTQLAEGRAMREAQENVAKAESKLAEDSLFNRGKDSIGIVGADTSGGGRRNRRKRKAPTTGLGI